ncbi:MAG: hypothetical protein K8T26_20200 [Lentisphaerae bacterium]|nr:hypothetical protein [Lentisphaerota bacterium]
MRWEVILKYPFIVLTGFLITFLLTPAVRRLGRAVGMMDQPDARRVHQVPIPRSGGLAVFLGFHAACAMIFLPPWIPFVGELTALWWWQFLVLSSGIVALGIADDLSSLRPAIKLIGQILVALLAYAWDMRVGKVLGLELPLALDVVATVLWFLAIINAFNLIDGLDGLATGLAIIAALGLAGASAFRHTPGDTLVLLGLIGACAAFLRYNFHPASIFLGDGGSMFLGFTLAAVALSTHAKSPAATAIAVPLLAMGVPILDTALAVWRRTARRLLYRAEGAGTADAGQIFQADRDHVHHRLLRSGLSQPATATTLYGGAIALVAVALLAATFRSHAVGIYILAFVAGSYVMVRHLATVELWDSGRAIASGLSRPPNRVFGILLVPALDVAILSLALAIAVSLSGDQSVPANLREHWFDQIPLWVGLPFTCLVLARTYQRVWRYARVSEFVGLALALLAGILLAAGLAVLMGQFAPPMELYDLKVEMVPDMTVLMLRRAVNGLGQEILIYACLATLMVAGLRALPRTVQDALDWRRHRERGPRRSRTILLWGAGEAATLYLLEQSHRRFDAADNTQILALLDDDATLHGLYVHGLRVAGGLDRAAEILDRERVDAILVTQDLPLGAFRALEELATRHAVPLQRWRTVVEPARPPAP